MDGLFLGALESDRPLARRALYIRAHWLRMPPLMLARHLAIKAFRGGKEGATR
jgi:hypothetical protein